MRMYLWTALSGFFSSVFAMVLSTILVPLDVLLSLVSRRKEAEEPRTVVITGATSGIGKALAVSYSKPGTTVVLSGRSPERLAETEAECRALGARVVSKKIDVTDEEGMKAWLEAVHAEHEVDMVVANAGVSEATCGTRNDPARAARVVLPINITGVMNTVVPLIDAFKARGSGQIVIVSSLAGFGPLTGSSSYSASKAAVKVWGEALRTELACFGVHVNVVCPGFVRSPMTAVNTFYMPGLIDMKEAVACIRGGLREDLPVIAFPSSTYFLAEIAGALPATAKEAAARLGILPGMYFYRRKPRAARGAAAAASGAAEADKAD